MDDLNSLAKSNSKLLKIGSGPVEQVSRVRHSNPKLINYLGELDLEEDETKIIDHPICIIDTL